MLLVGGIVSVLTLPNIQTQLALRLTQSLQENTQANLDIGKIKIDLLGNINFDGIVALDHRKDTLFHIPHFQAKLIEAGQAINGSIVLTDAKIEGLDLRLKKYEGDSLTNLAYYIQKLQLNSEEKDLNTLLKIDDLLFSGGQMTVQNPSTFKKPINIDHLDFEINQFEVTGSTMSGIIKNLSFKSNVFAAVHSFEASVSKSAREVRIDAFSLSTAKSNVTGTAQFKINPSNQKFENFTVALDAPKIDPKEWQFSTYFNDPIATRFTASGNWTNISVDTLSILSQDINLSARGRVQLTALGKVSHAAMQVDSMGFETTLLKRWVEQGILPKTFHTIAPAVKMQYQGEVNFSPEIITATGQLMQAAGYVDITAERVNSEKDTAMDLKLKVHRWDIASLVPSTPVQQFSGTFSFLGKQKAQRWINAKWDMQLDEAVLKKYTVKNISSSGTFANEHWRGSVAIQDSRVKGESQFSIQPNDPAAVNSLTIKAETIDLNLLQLANLVQNTTLSGNVRARFTGFDPNQINGNFQFTQWQLNHEEDSVLFDDFSLEAHTKNNYRSLSILNSDLVEGSIRGNYRLTDLGVLFKNTLSRAYPFAIAQSFSTQQNALVNIRLAQKVLNATFPDWQVEQDFVVEGLLHSNPNKGRLRLSAPLLQYKKSLWQGLELTLNAIDKTDANTLMAKRLVINGYEFDSLRLSSTTKNDGLALTLQAKGGKNKNDFINFSVLHTVVLDKELRFQLMPSSVQFKNFQWELSLAGNAPTLIRYFLDNKTLAVQNFNAVSGYQRLRGSGFYRDTNTFAIQASTTSIELAAILPTLKNFDLQGKLTSDIVMNRSLTQNNLDIKLAVDGLNINQDAVGDLTATAVGNTQLKTYNTALQINNALGTTLDLRGTFQKGKKDPLLNLDLNFKQFDVSFLNALAKGSLDGFHGRLNGEANLWGPMSNLRHDGKLELYESGLRIPYLNIQYDFDPAAIVLNQQSFSFSRVSFRDPKFETRGMLSGSFSHNNFKDWSLDFDLSADRILVYDIQESPERIFYGQGFFGGRGQLSGPTKSLELTLDGATMAGTYIKIPWTDDYGLVDTSFIDFVSKAEMGENESLITPTTTIKKPFEMDFELDVTKDATIEIVIDPTTNSSLSGKGVGTLLMEINTDDKFNMWGDFLTTEGVYNFKNLGVIEKKFILKPGGSVSWEGDPLGAQMNMEAVYAVPGGANPALLLDNPNFNRKIPTEVVIQLQGNLLQPDDPNFTIQFPNTNNVVVSEINYRLADPQRSQLQAISLLSQGVFISDVSVSVQGITNNLYEKASDVLSSLVGEQDEKLKVGVNYLQGDRSETLAVETEDRLGLTLSTQISDKILINGKIGVPVGGVVQTQVVGDVQIDFILNNDGSLRAKVFNKENEFRYIGEDFGYTQGLGLSYNVDFNDFRDLIRKIKKKAISDSIKKQEIKKNTPDLLQFRDKN